MLKHFFLADNLARGGCESILPLLSHRLGAQHAFSGAHSHIDSNIKGRSSGKEVDEEEEVEMEEGVKKGKAEEEM